MEAFSQTENVDSTKQLKEFVVTANRNHSEIQNVPYSYIKLNKKDLENSQYRTTPEALTGSSGIFVQKTNHGGGSPFIRGLTGNQILLLMDGVRLNNSIYRYGPNQYFNTIDVYSISHIEAVKGTGSVQYGSDALGGVIQVFTKEPNFSNTKEMHSDVQIKKVSQQMELSSHAEIEYQSKKIALLMGATLRDFGDLFGGDSTGKQSPSGYKENAVNGKLKINIGPSSVLTFAYQYFNQKNVPLYHRIKQENFEYYLFEKQNRQLGYAKIEHLSHNKLFSKASIILSTQQSLEKRNYHKNNDINKFIEEDKVSTIGFTTDILSQFKNNWSANSGIEFYYDKVRSNRDQITISNSIHNKQRGLYPALAKNANFSVYSLHHLKLFKFKIESGLRHNIFNLIIPDAVLAGKIPSNIQISPSSLVGNLAVSFPMTNFQSIYASISTGYRMPNIDDMGSLGLVDFRYEIPAYDIKPEKSYNTELGYKFVTRKEVINVSIFYIHLSDIITRTRVEGEMISGYNVYIKENSQESFLKGFEFSMSKHLFKKLMLSGNVSYCYGQNLSKNEPLRRIPPFNGRVAAIYNLNKFQMQFEYLFADNQNRLAQGDKDDNRIPLGGTPSWHIVNFSGSYEYKYFTLFSGIHNITNKDYRTHGSGINGVGRSLYLTLQFKLKS
jgi:outer membrane cobalamin receptor